MRTIGLDIGDKRTGVAISDPQGTFALPLTVLDSAREDSLIGQILKIVEQYEAQCIVVGLPRHLDGELGAQASKATAFADKLALRAKQSSLDHFEVRLWDERLSTRAARRLQAEADGRGSRLRSNRNKAARKHGFRDRAKTDAIAAALILQGYLDSPSATRER
jgi:putative Holliday junction resolvase